MAVRKRKNKKSASSTLQAEEEEEELLLKDDDNATEESTTNPNSMNEEDEKEEDPLSTTDGHSNYQLTPLIELGPLRRLDVGPFAFLYLVCVVLDHVTLPPGAGILVSLLFALTLICHASLVVATQWSMAWKVAVGYQKFPISSEKDMVQWTHCFVQSLHSESSSNGGLTSGIAPIRWEQKQKQEERRVAIVNFQDHIFRCCPVDCQPDGDVTLWNLSFNHSVPSSTITSQETACFRPLFYPINLPIEFYASWKGHSSLSQINSALSVYGANQTIVQLPSFGELLLEQLVAPFFLFQVFCVVLWSLDEYWVYAIFTLGALIMFESTLAFNRQQSLQRLHEAGNSNSDQRIWVRRHLGTSLSTSTTKSSATPSFSWMLLPRAELVPGDYVSVSVRSAEGTPVPADILLIQGSAVCDEALLTGESVPQLKQALDTTAKVRTNKNGKPTKLDLQDNQHKESILFGGTKLLVANDVADDAVACAEGDIPPDKGVTGMVLRTGFETVQGNLLRTMAHSARTADSIHTFDTFIFILLLVLCAVAAAAMVLKEGWYDERRNRFRLVLHVIIIVTSVVPPELPMELSLAVTNSVAALVKRCNVYCSELFRIPWAGEVNVCCFDKTGTLTSDEMRLRGVRVPTKSSSANTADEAREDEESALKMPLRNDDIPRETIRVMITCHSLTATRAPLSSRTGSFLPSIVGDPLEQAVLRKTGYHLMGNNIVASTQENGDKAMTILHRFAFSAKLKRMTVLAIEEGSKGEIWALTKGAPETLKPLLAKDSIPKDYDDIAFHHMSLGRRVLAMACRPIGHVAEFQSIKDGGRELVERDLVYAGFLVLECPLKADTKAVISELSKTGHKNVMITGDAILTAVEVARQVAILPSSAIVYKIQPKAKEFECVDISQKDPISLPLSRKEIPKLLKLQEKGQAGFCISGDVLIQIAQSVEDWSNRGASSALTTSDEKSLLLKAKTQEFLSELVPLISVFARHAPHQKEAVVAAFNHGGFRSLMVGDGTNDVGALKRAHVGISIISSPQVESKQREASDALSKMKKKSKKLGTKGEARRQRQLLEQLQQAQNELDRVELGDASVAAPFTSRAVSIKCVKDVIQQGRCTLVTMLQIYKILGINCLVNAMVLSNLFLHGVKQGDRQMTILGIAVATLFFFVTRAEPLPTLSETRPPSSVMCVQALLSIVLQFAVHLSAIALATQAALVFVDPYDPSLVPDGPFNPNVLNSCTFMLTCISTINTFAVNYRGRPFMQELTQNKLMYRSLQVCYSIMGICALEIFVPLNDLMQLTALPDVQERIAVDDESSTWLIHIVEQTGFPLFIFGLMVLDTVLGFGVERVIRRLF